MLPDLVGWSPSTLLRAALAGLTAFVTVVMIGRPLIRRLLAWKFRDGVYLKAQLALADWHAKAGKSATPTMGGLMIVAGLFVGMLLWAPITAAWLPLAVIAAFSGIGAIDDWAKLRGKAANRDGLKGRTKLLVEWAFALATCLALVYWAGSPDWTRIKWPTLGVDWPLDWGFVPLAALLLVGIANAANLTDGMDGLAAGVVAVAAIALLLGVVVIFAGYAIEINAVVIYTKSASVLLQTGVVLAASLAGACLGFLWFNAHPAEVFMGDTGSLAIGSALGLSGLLMKQELALLVAGGVLLLEAASVVLQVGWFKLTRKRLLRCAPLHHHFQLSGWAESKLVTRFWIVGVVFGAVSVVLWF